MDGPWPPEAVRLDLRYHETLVALGQAQRLPGRPTLQRRWRWETDSEVRTWLDHPEWWSRQYMPRPQGTSEPTGEPPQSPDSRQRDRAESGSAVARASNAGLPASRAMSPVVTTTNADNCGIPATDSPGGPCGLPQDADNSAPKIEESSTTDLPPVAPLTDSAPVLPALTAETAELVRVLRRWSTSGPRPWRVDLADAVAWFLRTFVGVERYSTIDLLGQVQRWDLYLEARAAEWGKAGSARGAKYPANWKNALLNWLDHAATWATSTPSPRPATNPGDHRGPRPPPPRRAACGAPSPFAAACRTDDAGE